MSDLNPEGLSAADYWEKRYSENGQSWSGNVNAALEREIAGMPPGTALDLGSGEGGDALWLAHNGWAVTAVDIAPSALAIGAAAQLPGDDITWVAADLATWAAPTQYDLVTSCFLHSTVDLPREDILRRAATAVAPGGVLLIVGHFGQQHWITPVTDESPSSSQHSEAQHSEAQHSEAQHSEAQPGGHDGSEHSHETGAGHNAFELPTPEALMASLFDHNPLLDAPEWQVVTSALTPRPVTMPDGTAGTIVDSILTIRRLPAAVR